MKKIITISMLVIILFALAISEVAAKPIDQPSPPIWAHTPGAHPTQHKTQQPTVTPTATMTPEPPIVKPTGEGTCDYCISKAEWFGRPPLGLTPMIHRPMP